MATTITEPIGNVDIPKLKTQIEEFDAPKYIVTSIESTNTETTVKVIKSDTGGDISGTPAEIDNAKNEIKNVILAHGIGVRRKVLIQDQPTQIDEAVNKKYVDDAIQNVGTVQDLDDLTDVTITNPSQNQVLKYNGTSWINASTAESESLDGLSDVTITNPSQNQVLKYNGTSWINASTAESQTLDSLSDVTITSPTKGQFVVYNGSQFINSNTIEPNSASSIALAINAAPSQTANLLEVKDSASNIISLITRSGNCFFTGGKFNGRTIFDTSGYGSTEGQSAAKDSGGFETGRFNSMNTSFAFYGGRSERAFLISTAGVMTALECVVGSSSLLAVSDRGTVINNVSFEYYSTGLLVNNTDQKAVDIAKFCSVSANKLVIDRTGSITTAGNAYFKAPGTNGNIPTKDNVSTVSVPTLLVESASAQTTNIVQVQNSTQKKLFEITPTGRVGIFDPTTTETTTSAQLHVINANAAISAVKIKTNSSGGLNAALSVQNQVGQTEFAVYCNNTDSKLNYTSFLKPVVIGHAEKGAADLAIHGQSFTRIQLTSGSEVPGFENGFHISYTSASASFKTVSPNYLPIEFYAGPGNIKWFTICDSLNNSSSTAYCDVANRVGFVIRAANSQTANLFEIRNSAGNILFGVTATGSIMGTGVSSSGVASLGSLVDVFLSSPSNGDFLVYNSNILGWENKNVNLFSGHYNDLQGTPTLSTVATTGSYNDLLNKPTIPSLTQIETNISNHESRISDLESSTSVVREVPSGNIDGTNTIFVLANTPTLGSEQVFVNGLLQDPGATEDYTISNNIITFAEAPLVGWKVYVNYTTGNYVVAPAQSASGVRKFTASFSDVYAPTNTSIDWRLITHNLNTVDVIVRGRLATTQYDGQNSTNTSFGIMPDYNWVDDVKRGLLVDVVDMNTIRVGFTHCGYTTPVSLNVDIYALM